MRLALLFVVVLPSLAVAAPIGLTTEVHILNGSIATNGEFCFDTGTTEASCHLEVP